MPRINPERYYSLLEVQEITGIKTRANIARYITEGKLLAIQTSGKGRGTRYAIKGDWVTDFIQRYKNGMVTGKQYSKEEAKELLEEAIKNLK